MKARGKKWKLWFGQCISKTFKDYILKYFHPETFSKIVISFWVKKHVKNGKFI